MDPYLDSTRQGRMYLAQESLARLVADSLRRGVVLGHYELGAYVFTMKAGLVARAEEYRWSSAWPIDNRPQVGNLPHLG